MALDGNAVYPYGLREIKLKRGATLISLPAAQTLKFTERVTSAELRGNDRVVVASAMVDAVEFEFASGGYPLDAIALMTGRTMADAGTTPSQTTTMTIRAGDTYPWFTVYGKSMGDNGDDIHVKLYKCKLTGSVEGEFKDQGFFVTSMKGLAVEDDAANTKTVTDIDVASNIATATATAHGLSAGQVVTIAGTAADYVNGDHVVISAPSADSFTFAAIGANVTNLTGTARTTHGAIADVVRNETATTLPS